MRRRRIEPATLMLLLLPTLSLAASREIGPGDDVEGSIAALAPGDELVLRGGVYSLPSERFSVDLVASPEHPIVIRSVDGERARLVRSNADQNLIDFVRAEYLEIRDIAFEGGSAGLRFEAGAHVTIEGCEISGTADVALRANDAGQTYVGFRILRNHIHDTGGTGEGMYLGCNEGACSFSDALIEGNWVHHTNGATVTQGDGIEIKEGSGGNVVRDNVIHDTGYPCILVYSTRGRPQNVIERNLLFHCGDHAIQAAADAVIRNNVILGANADGIAMQPHQSGTPQGLLVVHNTVLAASGDAISVRNPSGPVIVANNAIYSQSGMALRVNGTSSLVASEGNVGLGDVSVGSLAAGSVEGDLASASFAGEPPMSVFPKAGSALIGAGAVADVADDDFNGTPRNGVADAGAYAFGTGANPGWTLAAGFKGETPGGSEPGDDGSGGSSGGGATSAASSGCTSGASGLDVAVAALLALLAFRGPRGCVGRGRRCGARRRVA
jgi:hypothetical protein